MYSGLFYLILFWCILLSLRSLLFFNEIQKGNGSRFGGSRAVGTGRKICNQDILCERNLFSITGKMLLHVLSFPTPHTSQVLSCLSHAFLFGILPHLLLIAGVHGHFFLTCTCCLARFHPLSLAAFPPRFWECQAHLQGNLLLSSCIHIANSHGLELSLLSVAFSVFSPKGQIQSGRGS